MGEPASVVGIGASPGTRRGPVRVVVDASDFGGVKHGEILVTRFASPDVVLAFDRIVGFVTDQGGRLAHAAVVARELGVPAVVGTQDATTRLASGSVVVLDGDRGTVRVVSAKAD